MKNHLRVGATALALMTAVLRANADGTSTATLDEVIVTATRTTRALNSVPVSASVVSTLDIQDTPAQSLDDILRHVPGMNLPIQTGTEAHPTADNVSMRGLGGIHALVLVDGVPLNDPFFGYVQWGRIPLEAIDHVEVVRGGCRHRDRGRRRGRVRYLPLESVRLLRFELHEPAECRRRP